MRVTVDQSRHHRLPGHVQPARLVGPHGAEVGHGADPHDSLVLDKNEPALDRRVVQPVDHPGVDEADGLAGERGHACPPSTCSNTRSRLSPRIARAASSS